MATTAPVSAGLATEAAEAILKQIIEIAPNYDSAEGLKALAEAYAAVMGMAHTDTAARAPVRIL